MAESNASSWPYYRIGDNALSIQRAPSIGHMPHFHLHHYYEIFYIVKGERIFFINDRVYTVRPGDVVVIFPNTLHRTGAGSKAQECERILINFAPAFLGSGDWLPREDGAPFAGGHGLIHFPKQERSFVDHIIWEMLNECREQRAGYEDYIKSCLTQLLIRINRQAAQEEGNEAPPSSHPLQEKISEIAAFMNRNYAEDITLQMVSEKFYISPYYLCRMFKKLTGFQFREYLMSVRIKEAQKLLRDSPSKIIEIAHQVGFKHVAHFSTTFKKITRITPLAYRKRYHRTSDNDEAT
ncbi:AraC family transcriptional regulator [Paenibacillus sp.]|uniref:helix-turn-helix transcriptional regulator n=1 Tax=Paenibacillus sp. TaxID=58172 RepID=UPI002D2F7392|nr:AraC family transcriptional regulator [Paenibacillus sp.]HZG86003.1 AraC family transcriptional regulator [Paenibacillus sp.]